MTTGIANESVKATARSCGNVDSSVGVDEIIQFETTSFSVAKTGLHHLKAIWVLNFSVSLRATSGAAPQSAGAAFAVLSEIELENETTGVYVNVVSSGLSYGISSGTYAHSYPHLHEPVDLNLTLVAGDQYAVFVYVTAGVSATVTPGTCNASASLNMGSGGRDAVLSSIEGI